jgi:hypothetical protein
MSEPRFDIQFSGELLPGFTPETVAANLAKLFKATPETVARLMAGGTHTLKRDTDEETALKYQGAMARAGARAQLRTIGSAVEQGEVAKQAGDGAAAAPVALTLAPQSGELLAEHERAVPPSLDIDTSHIKLASAFAAAEPPQQATPPPPDTSHISIAEPGADLLPEQEPAMTAVAPDTSAITLAEPGAALAPQQPAQLLEAPDTAHLAVTPLGTPLEELRPERVPLNPDTSALQLEPLP